jgi:carboxypeptidase Q
VAALLAPIGATGIVRGGGGADIGALRPAAVPLLGLDVEGSRYFHWHHTPADTLDEVDRGDLARGTGAMAAMGWLLAEMEETLPRPSPSPSASPAAQ